MALLFADPPDWEDIPGAYQFTATIVGGIVINIAGIQMGDDGDMFAAFDDDGMLGVLVSCYSHHLDLTKTHQFLRCN